MKKFFTLALVLSSIMLGACTNDEDTKNEPGSIYGIVAELGTAEPMKAVGVELYKAGDLLLKTVTFDDGHFEFSDLNSGSYRVKVVADGYEQTEEGNVTVEAGRQARIDLQVKKLVFKNHMVVRTVETTISGSQATLNGEYLYDEAEYAPSEVGFVYATQNNPKDGGTLVKGKVNNETKLFSVSIEGLSKGTYYVQAYAKNKVGTEYGEVRSFEISGAPAVSTLSPTNITIGTATLNGRIEFAGNPEYTERGFVYSKLHNVPTIDDPVSTTSKVSVPGRDKDFHITVNSLTENATYYVRAYLKHENGTTYGSVLTFIPEEPQYVIIENLMVQKKQLVGYVKWKKAVEKCNYSRIGGYSDWRLPTIDEWYMIYYHNDHHVSGDRYWSSTKMPYYGGSTTSNNDHYRFLFKDGGKITSDDNSDALVLPVRTIIM